MKYNYSNHNYNKNLQPYANKLRKEMTKAEACLWKYVLKAKQLRGYQFRRQRPALNYIADFVCMELMLIIEVDASPIIGKKQYLKTKKNKPILKLRDLQFFVLRMMKF